MKQNLNEEIARIKKLLTLTESSVTEENEILEEQIVQFIKNLVPGLERKFVTSIEAKLGKKIATATDSEIGAALKSAEMAALRKEIAATIYASEKAMIDGVFAKYNMSVAGEASAAYRELQANGLNRAILKDVVGEYKAAAGKLGSASSAASSATTKQNTVLKPSTSTTASKAKVGEVPPNADEIINATAKSSAEAAAYMAQVEALGFDPKTTKLLQLEYSKAGVANKGIAEILEDGNALARQLNEKQYGWLKRIWASIAKDPATSIAKAGKAGYKAILWYSILVLAAAGAGVVFLIKDKIESKTGTKGSDILPSIPDANNAGTTPKKGKYD